MKQTKKSDLEYWNDVTKTQNRLLSGPKNRLQIGWVSLLYQSYKAEAYSDQVQAQWPHTCNWNRKTPEHIVTKSTKYMWSLQEGETEMHFLLHCEKYSEIRAHYFSKFSLTIQNILSETNEGKIKILLREGPIAAKCILACHNLRDTGWPPRA